MSPEFLSSMGLTQESFSQLPPAQQEQIRMQYQQMQSQEMQGQQQGGMNPGMAMQIGQQFMGGGAASAAPATGAASGGAASGGAAAGGGSAGGGSALAAAGPWAALAAGIVLNENDARKHGRRDEDMGSYATDLLSGAVLEQDAEAWGDKIGGPLGEATEFMGEMGNPEGIVKNIGKSLKPWEIFEKWF